ncbi:MAG: histidine kinase N-terminal 7TM domain-containing protein [Clostridiales bacterium]|nr:histidine kinase N-terminal 7TM domain-containing protein [Clostridiales bacterium]MDU1042373.1 histidine kinase N-terminal 7TM domain-containing protein [Clostridiales bacterium]
MTGLGVLMIIYMAVRTFRCVYIPEDNFVSRYLWYSYYPLTLIMVLFILFSVLHIGKGEEEDINPRWKRMYIPVVILSALMLTNDLHQKIFYFEEGISGWTEVNVRYGLLYFAEHLYIWSVMLAAIFISFIRCSIKNRRKYIWAPLLPLVLGFIYSMPYIIHLECLSYIRIAINLPEISCVIMGVFMENLIITRLIPSNDNYNEFWRTASIGGGIADTSGRVVIKSDRWPDINVDEIIRAGKDSVLLDKDKVLKSNPVSGGRCLWMKDISKVNELNAELQELGDILSEENTMIAAENKMREEEARIKEQSELYRKISVKLRPHLDRLNHMLEDLPEEEEAFRDTMKKASIINAYIKRYSNLLILHENDASISSDELKLSIEESMSYMEMAGIESYLIWDLNGDIDANNALMLYEKFENAAESSMQSAAATMTRVSGTDEKICLINAKKLLIAVSAILMSVSFFVSQVLADLALEKMGGDTDKLISLQLAKAVSPEAAYVILAGLVACELILIKKYIEQRRTSLSRSSIKESFYSLPDGVCFSSMDGMPFLVNQTMNEVCNDIFGTTVRNTNECDRRLE